MRASLISRLVWLVALAVPVHAQVVRQEIGCFRKQVLVAAT